MAIGENRVTEKEIFLPSIRTIDFGLLESSIGPLDIRVSPGWESIRRFVFRIDGCDWHIHGWIARLQDRQAC